jgi:predicted nucleotidyltransferase
LMLVRSSFRGPVQSCESSRISDQVAYPVRCSGVPQLTDSACDKEPVTGAYARSYHRFATMDRVEITLDTLRRRRDELLEVARRRGAKELWVIGSVARGDAGPSSDVDFLIEFEPGRSLLDQVHLIDELGAVLGTRVDVVARGGLLDRDGHIVDEAVSL